MSTKNFVEYGVLMTWHRLQRVDLGRNLPMRQMRCGNDAKSAAEPTMATAIAAGTMRVARVPGRDPTAMSRHEPARLAAVMSTCFCGHAMPSDPNVLRRTTTVHPHTMSSPANKEPAAPLIPMAGV